MTGSKCVYRDTEPGNTDPETVKLGHTNQGIQSKENVTREIQLETM